MGWRFWEKGSEASSSNTLPTVKASQMAIETQERLRDEDAAGGSLSRSLTQRTIDKYKVMGELDMRRVVTDINDLQGLDKRFAKEFMEASNHMERRVQEEKKLTSRLAQVVQNDLVNDKRYEHWQKEQQVLAEKLHIHWIDKLLDEPVVAFTWMLRIWTTIGIAVGVARTAYLWRTIDKTYAKLHGVTFSSISVYEISTAIMKGGAAAFVGVFGGSMGEAVPNLAYFIRTRDPAFQSRTWENIAAAGAGAAITSTSLFGALNRAHLTLRQRHFLTLAATTVAGVGCAVVGKRVYMPFVAGLEHRYDETHWRPWQMKAVARDGGKHMRGRLV